MLRLALMTLGAVTLSLPAGLLAADAVAPSPAGTWTWSYDYGNGAVDSLLTLQLKDRQVAGTYHGEKGDVEVKEGSFDGKQVTFAIDVRHDDQSVTVTFVGEPKEDALEGTLTARVDGEDHEFPWKAKRATRPEDVDGAWQLTVVTDGGDTYMPKVQIKQDKSKLSGKYISEQVGEQDLKAAALKENVLTFQVVIESGGHTLKVDYEGKPRGDQIAGTAKYDLDGTTGTAKFTGKLTPDKK